jgi:hypothetical protein
LAAAVLPNWPGVATGIAAGVVLCATDHVLARRWWYVAGGGHAAGLNASSYPAYVAAYVAVVQPDVLCMDQYPNFAASAFNSTGASLDAYLFALAVMRVNALAADINFWNFFGVQHVYVGLCPCCHPCPVSAALASRIVSHAAVCGSLPFCIVLLRCGDVATAL